MKIVSHDKVFTLGEKLFIKLPIECVPGFISGLCNKNADGVFQCFILGVHIYSDVATIEYSFGFEVEE